MNIAEWENKNLAHYGDYEAAVIDGQVWTSHALYERACRFARALVDLGVVPADRVLLLLHHGPEILVAASGIWRCGAVVVLAYAGSPPLELARIVSHAAPTVVVASAEVMDRIDAKVPHRIVVGEPREPRDAREPRNSVTPPLGFDALIARHDPLVEAMPRLPTDVAQISYTSGTTGAPKGVAYTHGGSVAFLDHLHGNGAAPPIVALDALPPTAFGGRVIRTRFATQTKLVLLSEFTPEIFLSTIEERRVANITLVPSMAETLLDFPRRGDYDLSSLEALVVSGASMSTSLAERLEAAFRVRPTATYGLTEAGGPITLTASVHTPGSVGRVLPGVELRILDEEGNDVTVGSIGEIHAKTPWMSLGFHDEPEQTASLFRDGWLRTGDLGRLDEHSELWVVGRRREMIIQNGVNAYPEEIAEIVMRIPAVKECAILGVHDPFLGEAIVACVVRRDRSDVTDHEVRDHCRAHMDPRKVPVRIRFLDVLPRNPLGKVETQELKRALEAEAERFETLLQTSADYRGSLAEASERDRAAIVEGHLRSTVGHLLRLSPDEVPFTMSLAALGLESIRTQRLRNFVRRAFGVEISPALLARSTVSEAAAVVVELFATPAAAGVRSVDGPAPLLPMQHWYLMDSNPNARVMHPVFYEVAPSIEPEAIEEVLRGLWEQHDALRSRFVRNDAGRWQLVIAPFRREDDLLTLLDATSLTAKEFGMGLRFVVDQLATAFKVGEGGLCQVGLLDHGRGRRLLVLVTHHLVSDQWSDFILTRDLLYACDELGRSGAVRLPSKTTDVRAWGETLTSLGETGAFEIETPHWRESMEGESIVWPSDSADTSVTASCVLDEAQTRALRTQAPTAWGATVEEIFAAAVALATARWTRTTQTRFNWLDAGRSELPNGVDLSRTVGLVLRDWPHSIAVGADARPGALIASLREQRRRVSHRGLGYNVLEHFGRDEALRAQLRRHPARDIRINYVGEGTELARVTEVAGFRRIHPPAGDSGSTTQPDGRPGKVDVMFLFEQGTARATVTYRGSDLAAVRRLADLLGETLRSFVS